MISSGAAQKETVLVQQAQCGDSDAFGQIYLLHLDAIFRYVFFRIGNQEDAEDITEQVFLKAWESLPGYQDFGHPFTSWLYRIAHNLVVDYHRRERTVPAEEMDQTRGDGHEEPNLLQQVIANEEVDLLVAALSRLSEEQQQVIVLRFIEGLNHTEVARILNKSEGACRMIQNRALVALNAILAARQEKQHDR